MEQLIPKNVMKNEFLKELARREFFFFCHVAAPDFYKRNRTYLIELCREMQDFYESDDEVLVVNVPPRHGKSRTASLFSQWIFGKNIGEKVMTGSYNETLSTNFSKSVRNGIMEQKAEVDKIVYSDIFPKTRIKKGDGAMKLWALEGSYANYLATSPTGTATGFGASVLLLDDLIKNSMEAYNEIVLDKHWDWFTNTMLSRLEEGGKIIIIMTRWANGDLAGRALAHFKEEGKRIRHVNMKALKDDGTMLCDEVLSRRSFESKKRAMGEDIAMANYQQEPLDAKGILYTRFNTYENVPDRSEIETIVSYTDTADQGTDSLVSIVAAASGGFLYVLDVICTDAPMEVTEPLAAKQAHEYKVEIADIESNNGGRGYARNVMRISQDDYNNTYTAFRWFHQNENKHARILSNATNVMRFVRYPVDWEERWPEYAAQMKKYQKAGKNVHDDAPDATTGLVEKNMHVLGISSFDEEADMYDDDDDFDDDY